jgi:hypothetical protein
MRFLMDEIRYVFNLLHSTYPFDRSGFECQLALKMRDQNTQQVATAPYLDKLRATVQPNAFYCTREPLFKQ